MSAPIARTTDPATSHEAAAEVTASGRRQRQVEAVADAVRRRPGHTAAELATPWLDRYALARRLPEAERDGLTRRGESRPCAVTGRRALTWWPSKACCGQATA